MMSGEVCWQRALLGQRNATDDAKDRELFYESARRSSRYAFVTFEQAAKSRSAANFVERESLVAQFAPFRFRSSPFSSSNQPFVLETVSLMRTFLEIMCEIFRAYMIHVLFATDHEPVEALLPDGMNESLDESICVRRAERVRLHLDSKAL